MTDPLRAGAVVELDVVAVVAGGDGLARTPEGQVVFVRGALPGERVSAEVTEVRRDFARAAMRAVVIESPDRTAPPCGFVALGCGGCGWQHVRPEAQLALKRTIVVDSLRRLGRIDEPPVTDGIALAAEGYRTTLRLAVDRDGRPALHQLASSDLVAVDSCLVAHPLLADLVAAGRWPGARSVTLRCGARTGETLVKVSPSSAGGSTGEFIHEIVAGRRWRISAASFFQARPDGADVLAATVTAMVREADAKSVVDLYCGVGLFAGVLADAGLDVVAAVEGSRSSVADARHNLGPDVPVFQADVTTWTPRPAEAVVADPAREGLGRAGVAVVAGCAPSLLVLVSCDAASLGRDARLLAEAGFTLDTAVPVDLFPHTPHVEIVSRFTRR
ncbi:MAG TPA: TRAM domain-containing protein [Acidimicrobiales bacterium]|nr:TRAM domain-containing protein [Acidimicrobiales bacterium]